MNNNHVRFEDIKHLIRADKIKVLSKIGKMDMRRFTGVYTDYDIESYILTAPVINHKIERERLISILCEITDADQWYVESIEYVDDADEGSVFTIRMYDEGYKSYKYDD